MSSLHDLYPAMKCTLSGEIMSNPVIVVHKKPDSTLHFGRDYERSTLEQWLLENGDKETRFVPNTNLKDLIARVKMMC